MSILDKHAILERNATLLLVGSLFVVTIGVLIFRFIVTRMPIFYVHPAYKDSSH